jgi:hypothetical protein
VVTVDTPQHAVCIKCMKLVRKPLFLRRSFILGGSSYIQVVLLEGKYGKYWLMWHFAVG